MSPATTGTTPHPPVYRHVDNLLVALHFFPPPDYAVVHVHDFVVLPAKNKFTFDDESC